MLKRFKAWLIKRLGGYTQEEYDDWRRIPIQKPALQEVNRSVITLKAGRTVDFKEIMEYGEQQMEIVTTRGIIDELANAMLPFVFWKKTTVDFKMRVEGVLMVVEPAKEGN
ncbi:MAG: hypothetical protein IJA11_08640 [Oscillospiraceae bacterium]|nr:hypothetical protein [Oscillospiraceae bacterium]